MKDNPIVSIIVPVYNAESTLHICLESLDKQVYKYMDVIFINDCSTDGSLAKIEEFAAAMGAYPSMQVTVLSHEINRGVAAARNSGLAVAQGKYIYFIDADDSLEPQALEVLVARAEEKDLELLGFNWFLTFANGERKMTQPMYATTMEAMIKMFEGTMKWNLWIFLIKRSLIENHCIRFIEGKNMGEDLLFMVKLLAQVQRIDRIDDYFYHYGQLNEGSLTKQYSDRHIEEVTYNVSEVAKFLQENNVLPNVNVYLNFLKLNIKLPMLISKDVKQYKKWFVWFEEANAFVDTDRNVSKRIQLLERMAVKKQYWFIKLHYFLIVKLYYGVFYK
ncbi:glycosyltransferase family 2 protein [Sphingobacterium lactis]|uniref:Glycosyl transferase family 2 n=1 Tax=Sphingobacterium lactis TaxID=797291 RepID=A0A1H6CLR2_9SPHI|nr:glycosyltransferase [Sphingobacterium lactis]SEG73386.1 Glycosyl transferase family 2 [Sphingobacterium lactis]